MYFSYNKEQLVFDVLSVFIACIFGACKKFSERKIAGMVQDSGIKLRNVLK